MGVQRSRRTAGRVLARHGRQLGASPADREYAGELGRQGEICGQRAEKQVPVSVKHGWRPKLVLSKPLAVTLVKGPR